jgi:hypothetical protein
LTPFFNIPKTLITADSTPPMIASVGLTLSVVNDQIDKIPQPTAKTEPTTFPRKLKNFQ